jgi:chromosome segregation protein
LGAQRETSEGTVSQTNTALEQVRQQLEKNNAILEDLGARQTAASALRHQITRQADRLRHEIDWRNSQIAMSEEDLKALRRRQDELTREIDERAQAQAQATARIQETDARLEGLPIEMLSDDLAAAQMVVATAKQTQQGQQSILLELTNSLNRLRQDRDTRLRRVAKLEQEEKSVTERVSQLNQCQADVTANLEALLARIEPTETRLIALEEEQTQLEAQERLERVRLREFEGHLTNARIAAQRREDELNQLRGRIEEDLGLVELELGPSVPGQTPLPLHPLVSKLPVVQQLPEGVQDEIKRLRLQLRRLGAINPNAPQDYKETRERYSFLQEQSVDLTEASESLRKVITEMDGLIEHAFRQTFEAVASRFSTNFTSLFDGGKAQLELTVPDDPTQTGVEIVAQPPGKRLQALASLSGGERALTAVALIFAILQVSPPPFCFLDEVDAMLDEANIGRFRTMLESLTDHTQIVIITHNRGTITAADTVYGVSMGADSASQVYSIRMDGDRIKEI